MNAAESKRNRAACGEAKVIPLRPIRDALPRKRRKIRPVRYLTPVNEEQRAFDPLTRETSARHRMRIGVLYILAAVALHVGTAALLLRFGENGERATRPPIATNVLVNIQMPAVPEPEPEPTPTSVAEPVPIPEVTNVLPQRVSKSPSKPVQKAAREIPADPLDVPKTAPENVPPVRKVVGISFESTVTGGNGPAMAVGNTRMGETGRRADDPSKIKEVGGGAYRGPGSAPVNRVATAVPTDGISLVKPKRLASVTPAYPSLLKSQGIEGDVAVLIRISPEGAVLDARVIKGSGQAAFDEAALDAAKKERFSPALRGGEAIEYTLKYTYRFRVTG